MKHLDSILYVEEDIELQAELKPILEKYCAHFYQANNGKDGLELYLKHSPDIVITAIELTQFTGIELIQAVRNLDKKAKVIIISHFANESSLKAAIDLQINAFFAKPVDKIALSNKLEEMSNNVFLQAELEHKTRQAIQKRAELEAVMSVIDEGAAIIDSSSAIIYANQSFQTIVGIKAIDLAHMSASQICMQEDGQCLTDFLAEVKELGCKSGLIKRYVDKHDNKKTLDISATTMPNKEQFLLVIKDITESVTKEHRLKEYVDLVDKWVITSATDLHGTITHASEAFCRISGYSKEELIGKSHNILRHPDMPKSLYKQLWSCLEKDKPWSGEIKNLKKDGDFYWVNAQISPVFDLEGNKIGYSAIRQDITLLKKVEQLSNVDELSGLYNRRFFNKVGDEFIQTAKRRNALTCFAVIDIDHFKRYNDTFGHQKGDQALNVIASTIKALMKRGDDYAFRLGGEEFGVLFKAKSTEDALSLLKRMTVLVKNLEIENPNSDVAPYLTISAGLVCCHAREISTISDLYREADKMLYKVKKEGRNAVFISGKDC